MEVLDIGLKRPYIFPPTILMNMLFMMVKVLECMKVVEDMDLSLKRSSNIFLTIVDFILLAIKVVTMEEVYIGLNTSHNSSQNHV